MPVLYLLIGMPCSGKSTWASSRKEFVLSSDRYIEEYASQKSKTYNEVFSSYISKATSLMWDDMYKAQGEGRDIIWDQTNLTIESRKSKLNALSNYKKVALVFSVADDIADRRHLQRIGKTIPRSILLRMKQTYQPPSISEGFDEIIMIP
jgi:predicted kinase